MAEYKTIKKLVAAIKSGQAVPGLRLVSAEGDMLLLLNLDEPHVVDTDDGSIHKVSEVSWPLEVAQHQPYHVQVALGWMKPRY